MRSEKQEKKIWPLISWILLIHKFQTVCFVWTHLLEQVLPHVQKGWSKGLLSYLAFLGLNTPIAVAKSLAKMFLHWNCGSRLRIDEFHSRQLLTEENTSKTPLHFMESHLNIWHLYINLIKTYILYSYLPCKVNECLQWQSFATSLPASCDLFRGISKD